MIQTVKENKIWYTPRQIEWANLARKLYHAIGSPSIEAFKGILRGNMIKNCPVTIADVDIAERIYGPSISTLKGKTTQQTPKPVIVDEVEIPPELLINHRKIELYMDTMFVNGEGILTTIDKTVRFRSSVPIKARSANEYMRALHLIIQHYDKGGFQVI